MSAVDRQAFVITLRPEKHCLDPIRALRAVLKRSLRDHGMRCISIRPQAASADNSPMGESTEISA